MDRVVWRCYNLHNTKKNDSYYFQEDEKMKLKKVFATALTASLVLALAACTKTQTPETGLSVDDSQAIVLDSEEGIGDGEEVVVEDGTVDDGYVDEEQMDEKAFIGTWVCGRASIVIEPESNGYAVNIHWGNSAAESSEWTYFCVFDGEKLVNHGDGVYKIVTYTDDVNFTEDVQYDDGSVSFELVDGNLIWNDEKEDAGNDMTFEYVEIADVE